MTKIGGAYLELNPLLPPLLTVEVIKSVPSVRLSVAKGLLGQGTVQHGVWEVHPNTEAFS